MTQQKTFKRRVRARMAKTGESYTAARRMLIDAGEVPDTAPATAPETVSDDAVTRATGHPREHWFALLDAWGATHRTHTQIARWLVDEQEVPGWWAQTLTVDFERARGMRLPGQHADGFTATATRTVAVPVERLYAAVTEDAEREGWLPGAELRLRTKTAPRSARYDWEDGATRLVIGFEATGEAKSRIALAHERLPDADAHEAMKAFWRERLTALKALLEA